MSETAKSTGNGTDGANQPPSPIEGGNPPPAPQEPGEGGSTTLPVTLEDPPACADLETGEGTSYLGDQQEASVPSHVTGVNDPDRLLDLYKYCLT